MIKSLRRLVESVAFGSLLVVFAGVAIGQTPTVEKPPLLTAALELALERPVSAERVSRLAQKCGGESASRALSEFQELAGQIRDSRDRVALLNRFVQAFENLDLPGRADDLRDEIAELEEVIENGERQQARILASCPILNVLLVLEATAIDSEKPKLKSHGAPHFVAPQLADVVLNEVPSVSDRVRRLVEEATARQDLTLVACPDEGRYVLLKSANDRDRELLTIRRSLVEVLKIQLFEICRVSQQQCEMAMRRIQDLEMAIRQTEAAIAGRQAEIESILGRCPVLRLAGG